MSLLLFHSAAQAQDQSLIFSVMADIPYDSAEAVVLQQQIASHNKYSPSEFIAHLGDFRGNVTNCRKAEYRDIAAILETLKVPCFVVPGDNEYNDCDNPSQAWSWWTEYFFEFEKRFCSAPLAERQSSRPENFAFVRKGVLFIGINLVGGRVHDPQEWNTRMQDDASWIDLQFQTKRDHVRAAVIFSQAGPAIHRNTFFIPFRQAAAAFGKPVLFMHGDGHDWIQDRPFPEQNVLRIQVDDGGTYVLPLQVTVKTDTTSGMFAFVHKPWSRNSVPFNMPPCVDAGADQSIVFSQPATLNGSVSDDGDPTPPGKVAVFWSKVSGPGTVTFSAANKISSTASFSGLGTYELRLSADDGELKGSDKVTITVSDGKPIITSFSPPSGPGGIEVVITGSYFAGVTGVTFNGKAATSFNVENASRIRATVPAGATAGKISVSNAYGSAASATDFVAQAVLRINIFGYGTVRLDPPGGVYNFGVTVKLTPTPASGYQFGGWSPASETTIIMNADKNLTAIFTPINPSRQITHEETRTGGASDTLLVKTATSLSAVSGHLYLAAISTRPKTNVTSVSGLGLDWNLLQAQCSGRNATNVELWKAQGLAKNDDYVTATLADETGNAAIAVSRYSGVENVAPIGNTVSGNTNGVNGACSVGVDTNFYAFNLTATRAGAMIYAAVAMRSRLHTPGSGYTERAEIQQGSSAKKAASVAVMEQSLAAPATVAISGAFNDNVDFAAVAVEMLPPLQLTLNQIGEGTVTLDPPGGHYNAGTVVTLKAIPGAGYQFGGWRGDAKGMGDSIAITMNANKTVAATFKRLQFKLTINNMGAGNVAKNPAGSIYDHGTVVTLTAKPALGFQFTGWSGALAGTTNPAMIAMDGPKTVAANFSVILVPIVNEETKTGGTINSATVSTVAKLTAKAGQLYLAAISMRPKTNVLAVLGLGLSWTLVKAKCSAQNSTGIEVWMAQGKPTGSGKVTATFADTTSTAVMAVSRYSGVVPQGGTSPLGNVLTGNAKGTNGSAGCSGGVESNAYSFNLAATLDGAVIYGAMALKDQAHTPASNFIERAEAQQLNGVNTSGVAVIDQALAKASTAAVNGAFSRAVDWALVALEIKPQTVPQFTLTMNTVGSGSVALNPGPTGGLYNQGTAVTLTAIPAAGFQFTGWSGDLNLASGMNPTTIVIGGNKTVTANFIATGPIAHEETRAGGSVNAISVKTSAGLAAKQNHLYLAAISTRPKVSVSSVAGLGWNWKLVKTKCAGRNTTGIEIWMAMGEPREARDDDTVQATFDKAPISAVIAVSRYSGVDAAAPLGNVVVANTNGLNANGACAGGVDTSFYAVDLATTSKDAFIYNAVALKAKVHTPAAGYFERAEILQSAGANTSGLAAQDRRVAAAATVKVAGAFNGSVDWALVALELKPKVLGKKEFAGAEHNEATTPTTLQLSQNFPNPFNAQSVIEYSLPQDSPVRLVIYNTVGQIVRRLVDETQTAGRHRAVWNGENESGAKAGSGVYFYQLEIGKQKLARKMVLQQ